MSVADPRERKLQMHAAVILHELNRRKVLRVGGAYLALGLGTIYAADVILPRLGLPGWTVTLVIVLVGLGLPLALGLAWAFDLTEAGIRRTSHPSATEPAEARLPTSDEAEVVPASGPEGPAAIVVLPFADMSPGGDHEYFSDGLTEEIITDLAGVRSLKVISRTSAMCLKNTEKTVREIGRTLGVRYVLEGSVRVAGSRLRITAQLIDARTDAHLWADRYDGAIDEVFDVQERVAREIVDALDLNLTREEEERLSDHPVADVRAFEMYLKAREQLRRFSTAGVDDLIRRAMEIEGETAPLRALAAWRKVTEVRSGTNRDPRLLEEAESEAAELLRSPAHAGLRYSLLGFIAFERGRQALAVHNFERALAYEPNDADALFFQAIAYNAAGRTSEAARVSARFLETDPLNPNAHMVEGAIQWFMGGADEAPPHLARALELDPTNHLVRWCAGYTSALLGDIEGARKQADWMSRHLPEVPYTAQLAALVHGMVGEPEQALAVLSGVDTTHLDGHHLFHLAESHAMAGDLERGLELLALGVKRGFYPYDFVAEYCPFLEPLRAQPAFAGIRDEVRRRHEAFDAEIAAVAAN